MNVLKKGSVANRSVTLLICFVLTLAIVSWNASIASAQVCTGPDCGTGTAEPPTDSMKPAEPTAEEWANIAELLVPKDDKEIKIKFEGDQVKFEGGTLDGKGTSLETFKTKMGTTGVLKVTTKNGERSISLKDLPTNLKSVEVNEVGDVVYSIGEEGKPEGKITVGDAGVSVFNKDGKTVVKGYKVGGTEQELTVTLGEGGEVLIPGEFDTATGERTPKKGTIAYKGKAKVEMGNFVFEASGSATGRVFFYDDEKSFIFKNSKIDDNDKKIRMEVGDEDVFYNPDGSTQKFTSLEHKTLSFEGGILKGDVTGIKSLSFSNEGEKALGVEIKAKDNAGQVTDYKVPIDAKNSKLNIGIKVSDGKILATKEGVAISVVSSTSVNKDKPDLPDAGDVNTPTVEGEETPPGNSTPPVDGTPPGDGIPPGGGTPPGGGSSNWLMWALIIGAAILAAMLLFGSKKDKGGDDEPDDGIDDGGEPYHGVDNATDVHGNVTDDGQKDKTTYYNPSEPVGAPCVCNEDGCFRCPDDNCYKCTKDEKPNIQLASDDADGDKNKTDNS